MIEIDGIFDEGFVTMEWDKFLPAPRAGDPYCLRHQTYADSAYFNFVLDLGQGMQKLLGESGRGNVTPGQLLQVLGSDESGIVRMAEQASAALQSAIRSR